MTLKKILLYIGIFFLLILATIFGMFLKSTLENQLSSSTPTKSSIQIPSTPSQSNPYPLKMKASIPYWDQENAFLTFKENVALFDTVHLFWYYVGKQGTIEKYEYAQEDRNIIEFARSNNVKVIPLITNLPETGTWDKERVGKILNNATLRKTHIRNIIQKIDEYNFDGIDMDYEQLAKTDKNAYSQFLSELSIELHKKNKLLVVALHPKREENQSKESIGDFQDWSAIGKSADQLSIMAYDQHWNTGSAGPIASIEWVNEIIAYATRLNIPQEKFYLGVPLDGYDWNKDDDEPADGVTYDDVSQLLSEHEADERWDTSAQSPYFFYKEDGDTHEVWYENTRSTIEKMKAAQNAGFGGVNFWRLGGEDPTVWEAVKPFK